MRTAIRFAVMLVGLLVVASTAAAASAATAIEYGLIF